MTPTQDDIKTQRLGDGASLDAIEALQEHHGMSTSEAEELVRQWDNDIVKVRITVLTTLEASFYASDFIEDIDLTDEDDRKSLIEAMETEDRLLEQALEEGERAVTVEILREEPSTSEPVPVALTKQGATS